MQLPLHRAFFFVFAAAAASLLAGCTTKPADAVAPGGIVLAAKDYEYVYVTGSNIPVLMPKNSAVRALPQASPVSTLDPETFREVVRRGQSAGRR